MRDNDILTNGIPRNHSVTSAQSSLMKSAPRVARGGHVGVSVCLFGVGYARIALLQAPTVRATDSRLRQVLWQVPLRLVGRHRIVPVRLAITSRPFFMLPPSPGLRNTLPGFVAPVRGPEQSVHGDGQDDDALIDPYRDHKERVLSFVEKPPFRATTSAPWNSACACSKRRIPSMAPAPFSCF